MKLPQVQYGPVQSLGRGSLRGPAVLASAEQQQGNAMQRALTSIAGVTADYIERKENAEYNNQIAEYHIELSEWQARHNAKQFYTADEIGDTIDETLVPRVTTSTDDNGVQTTEFRKSIPAYEVYPHLLQQKLEGMIRARADKISNPNLRNAFLNKAGSDAATLMMRATVVAEQAQQNYNLEVGMFKAREAASSGNLVMAKFLINNLETDDLAKSKLLKEAEGLVEIYEVTQSIRSTNPDTVMSMLRLLDDENYSGNLTENQRQQAINDLNQRLKYLGAERDAEQAKAHEKFISDAYVGIENGTFTLTDVERFHEVWVGNENIPKSISGVERTRMRAAINARNAKIKNQKDLVNLGGHLVNFGGDPKDSDHQKAIDALVAEENSDLRRQEEVTVRSGIMPQRTENFLNTAALHNAEQGAENIPVAVELYGRLSDQAPHVLAELGKESKDILADAHIMVRGGIPVMEAFEISRENTRMKPELREQRERDYREGKYAEGNLAELDDFMDEDDTIFGFEGAGWNPITSPVAPDQRMEAEFQALTEMHYLRGGNIDLARKRAWDDMRQTWSLQTVGTNRLTAEGVDTSPMPNRYAPERVMAVTPETAKKRLEAFAAHEGINADHLAVMSDDRTARDGSWAIWIIDPETELMQFHPKRWVGADWAEEAKEIDEFKKLQEGIAKRDSILEQERQYKMFKDPKFGASSFGAQVDKILKEGGN